MPDIPDFEIPSTVTSPSLPLPKSALGAITQVTARTEGYPEIFRGVL
jgi:hypothetical protein